MPPGTVVLGKCSSPEFPMRAAHGFTLILASQTHKSQPDSPKNKMTKSHPSAAEVFKMWSLLHVAAVRLLCEGDCNLGKAHKGHIEVRATLSLGFNVRLQCFRVHTGASEFGPVWTRAADFCVGRPSGGDLEPEELEHTFPAKPLTPPLVKKRL